jgi:hypothetical protein
MRMKTRISPRIVSAVAIALIAVLLQTTASAAITATLNRVGGASAYGGRGGGGEFIATVNDDGAVSVVPTFCLEVNEHISLGTQYTATIDPVAITGGSGGVVNGAPYGNHDPLGFKTAWIYWKYVSGDLDSMMDAASSDGAFKNALQKLIWKLEQETLPSGYTSEEGSIFLALKGMTDSISDPQVVVPTGYEFRVPGINSETVYTISVLNLYTSTGAQAQSQLYYTVFDEPNAPGELPEPMTLAMWSGLSILGLGMARRQRRKVSA